MELRVLMLSWEFPPRVVGGLAPHVYELSRSLQKLGIEVTVVTYGDEELPEQEDVAGVKVYRVRPYHGSALNFVHWVMHLNMALFEQGTILSNREPFDLIHAHDWLVAYSARGLKHAFRTPLVATIHATEHGRNHGLHTDEQRYISDVEWWLTYEAWRVICCSRYMKGELQHVFQLPTDKIEVIYNGVDGDNFSVPQNSRGLRDRFAAPDERIVFYIGRLVREKGVQVLIDAAPEVLKAYPHTKFIIAGRGPYLGLLERQVKDKNLQDRFYFTGYIDDSTRNAVYRHADVAVFPSLYEPFGIVALEAMAAGTPVVVSDTGGLAEIVNHDRDGLKAYPGDPNSLAAQIKRLLGSDGLRRQLSRKAMSKVKSYFSWVQVARQTSDVYSDVIKEASAAGWRFSQAYPADRGRQLFLGDTGRYSYQPEEVRSLNRLS